MRHKEAAAAFRLKTREGILWQRIRIEKQSHWQRLRALHPCFCKAEIILSHLLLCDVLDRSGRTRLMGSILGATGLHKTNSLKISCKTWFSVSTAIIDCQSTHSRTSSISWSLGATLKNLSPNYHFELGMEPRNPKNGVKNYKKNGLKIAPRISIIVLSS